MKTTTAILTALSVLTICSCGQPAGTTALRSVADRALADMATSRTVENYLTPPREQEPDKVETVERKIIKNGSIRFAAADVNETKSLITQTVQELKGYISDDNASGYSNRIEHRLIIRIPADKFDLLLNTISKRVNKLDDKKIEVLDVTEEYIDIEARTKTKKELQSRYAALLERAETVEDILRIEKEIGGLQTEIESVEGRMRYLKDRIAFSTLTVTYYQEIDEPASPFGFSSKFTEGIKNGWDNFLWFIIGLSHLWVFILLAVIIYFVRRWGKKYRSTN